LKTILAKNRELQTDKYFRIIEWGRKNLRYCNGILSSDDFCAMAFTEYPNKSLDDLKEAAKILYNKEYKFQKLSHTHHELTPNLHRTEERNRYHKKKNENPEWYKRLCKNNNLFSKQKRKLNPEWKEKQYAKKMEWYYRKKTDDPEWYRNTIQKNNERAKKLRKSSLEFKKKEQLRTKKTYQKRKESGYYLKYFKEKKQNDPTWYENYLKGCRARCRAYYYRKKAKKTNSK
jgi:hypothetical protein